MNLEIILPILLSLSFILAFYLLKKKLKKDSNLVEQEVLEEYMIEYTPSNSPLTFFESELLDLINERRSELGFVRLTPELKCREIANEHTLYMISKGKPSHDLLFKRRFDLFRRGAKLYGENVGYGYSTPNSFFNAYMKSDGHKKVIETKEYTHIGVKALKDKNGKYYNTLIFTKF